VYKKQNAKGNPMSDNNHSDARLSMNPVALSSYAVSVCAFAGAGIGLISSHFPAGGMAAVGGFYLIVGVISQLTSKPQTTESAPPVARHASGAENLVAEAITSTRDSVRHPNLAGSRQ